MVDSHSREAGTVGEEVPARVRQASRLDLNDLRWRGLESLATLQALGAATAAWYYLPNEAFRWRQSSLAIALLLVGLASYLVGRHRPLHGVLLLVGGQLAAALAAAVLVPGASILLFCLPIATSTLIIWTPAPLLAALLATAGQYGIMSIAGRPPLLALSVITYGALGVTLYLSGDAVQHTLAWSWKRHGDALLLAEQLRDRQGELNRTIAALDLAYRLLQRSNHELAQARQEADEARRLKEQFAANISHELRTPLNLILGFSEMMYLSPHVYGDSGWSPALRRDISQIYTASRHLLQLVDDVMDLSRLNAERVPLRKQLCDLGQVIEEAVVTVREFVRDRPLRIFSEIDPTVPRLLLDATRIRQALLNLLNNAIRFTDNGEIVVRCERQEQEVLISVADTGTGIAETELESIFDEFYQAQGTEDRPGKGMGLGLAIAKRFVQMHAGRIWAESAPGRGSTFYIALPLDGARPAPSRLRTSRPLPMPDNPYTETIVLIGGQREVARLLERHLGGTGRDYHVLVAENAEDAQRLVSEHHPRCLICNLSLTKLRALAAQLLPQDLPRQLPVLYTAIPCPAWRAEMLGVYASLQKPVQREQLLNLLSQLPDARDILVIDDDLGFAQVVVRMLETVSDDGRNYHVRTAFTGSEGLAEAQRRQPDVILLDLRMPPPDGYAVLAALQADASLRQVPVVIVTAGDVEEEAAGLETGLVALAQRAGWDLGSTLKAIPPLLDLARPDYGQP